jgi:hypothetical protein
MDLARHHVDRYCHDLSNVFGLELRIELGGELIESRLSRFGEEPLILIAEQAKAELIAQGWCEQTPNVSPSSQAIGD